MAYEIQGGMGGRATMRPARVYAMGAVFLAIGLATGYVARGPQRSAAPMPSSMVADPHAALSSLAPGDDGHGLDAMKQTADKKAEPLLERLKSAPNDPALLAELGAIYHTSHQFSEAASYYGKAVRLSPADAALRIKLASSLYRNGDVDGAITQLDQVVRDDRSNANALFDLGMIRLEGKQDGRGALAAWQQLLRTNPQLSPERKAKVEKLMADVMTTMDRSAKQ